MVPDLSTSAQEAPISSTASRLFPHFVHHELRIWQPSLFILAGYLHRQRVVGQMTPL